MKIGIDARFLTHPQPGGFKTYTQSLVSALARADGTNQYILYVDREPKNVPSLPDQSNFTYRVLEGSTPFLGPLWREQAALPYTARKDRLDLLHSPCLTAPVNVPCPLVVTIHDMLWLNHNSFISSIRKDLKRKIMAWYYQKVPRLAIQNAAVIITVSHASKNEIVAMLGIPENRIVVTHEAVSDRFIRLEEDAAIQAVRRKYRLPPEFVLAIGSADPRKNIAGLLQAYAGLQSPLQDRFPLGIIWTHGRLRESIQQLGQELKINDRIFFIEQVSDADLVALYNAAALFVFPSKHEGFGLPVLEAMACGTPVVAGDNSSIPEIAGDAALLVPIDDTPALTAALMTGLTDSSLRMRLLQKGLDQVKKYSWGQCAAETIAAYRMGCK